MINQSYLNNIAPLYEAQKKLFETSYAHWVEHELFSFNWWFLLVITIVPWIMWWRLVDKKRLLEISFMGALVTVTAMFLDTVGISFLLWTYGYKLIQMVPTLNPVDFTVIPVCYMLLYQWFSKWKSYLIAHVVTAAGAVFIAEPLFVWMNIYTLHSWEYIYSFPFYIAIGVGFKWLIQKMKTRQNRYSREL
ncbi:CBO0543 family protein [Halobacillus amylolyticus]|uniref:Uncharacterized protein n=1 Tax=Halobacillus amylolyticus TaxID=2932259 RepID=A0ABY4HJL1_9BACI|nr:CBO0543 family protein [Halobacillus amylolyticus]UOR13670.1 hypothetical protein MUO15_09630 [Halobacillus amylolyticus]